MKLRELPRATTITPQEASPGRAVGGWLEQKAKKRCQASSCSLNQNTKDWPTCLKKKVLPWEEMMGGKTRHTLARNEDSYVCFHDRECSRRMQIKLVTVTISELAAWKEWRARVGERPSCILTYIPFYCEFLNQIDRSYFFLFKKNVCRDSMNEFSEL